MTRTQSVTNRGSIPLCEPWFPPSCADALRQQVLSGFVGPGRTTQAFGDALARFVGSDKVVLTTSGTVALSVAAKAVGLKPGDEILVPAYGVISTINSFASIGLTPRLVDIDRNSGCVSVERLAASFSSRTKAVCFVNFSGYTGENLEEAARLCAERRITLIEDAACAFGHRYHGQAAGTFGSIGTYSFSVPKVLTTGQGGAIVTNDPEVYQRAAAYIDQGDLEWRKTNLNRAIGTNLRFTDLQASLGLCQLGDIETRLQRRRITFAALQAKLGESLYSVPGDEAPLHNIVFTSQADKLVSSLNEQGIAAVRQYRTISHHPAYAELAENGFPNADYWTNCAVYLPFGIGLTLEHADRIAKAVYRAGLPLNSPGD